MIAQRDGRVFVAGAWSSGTAVSLYGKPERCRSFLGAPSMTFADEGTGAARVTLRRVRGSSGTLSVPLETASRTALSGSDFTRAATVVSFAPGEVEKTVSIPLRDDGETESSETFALISTGGAAFPFDPADPAPATADFPVTLIDNDSPAADSADLSFAPALPLGSVIHHAVAQPDGGAVAFPTATPSARSPADSSRTACAPMA